MERDFTYDMTKGSPTKLLIKFSIPMLIGNLFQQFYNMADAMIVGQFVGANALGAVGATGSINFLFFSLTFGLSAGVGVIISQLFGAAQMKRVKEAISTAMYIMILSSLLMGVLGIVLARIIMSGLQTPPEMLEDAILYMRITCAGMLAVGLYNGFASILRALGDSVTPLIFLSVACILNVVLDYVFVVSFGWGVLGVGVGTIIAQAVAAIGCIIFARRNNELFHIPLREIVLHKDLLKRSLGLGIPVALQNSMIAISCVFLQWVINGFGPVTVAAFTVENRFEQLVQQPFNSLGAALATYTGQNMGAGQIERVKKGFWAGTRISTIFSLIMLPINWIFAESIMRCFTSEEAVIAAGAQGIQIVGLFYAALGMIYVTRNVLNGSGDANFAMLSGFVEVGGRVGFAKPLSMIPAVGALSIWFTTGLTWTITALISCIRYGQGKWKLKGITNEIKSEQIDA